MTSPQITEPPAEADAGPPSDAAVATTDLVKIYGVGENEVRALDGVTVEFVE